MRWRAPACMSARRSRPRLASARATAPSITRSPSMSAIEQVEKILKAKADALVRRSAEDLAGLLHPDFTYVNAGGFKFDKTGYIYFGCTSGKIVFSEQKFSALEVKPFAGFAVATMTLHDRFTSQGRLVAATYRSLCAFSVSGNEWLWAAGQTMVVK